MSGKEQIMEETRDKIQNWSIIQYLEDVEPPAVSAEPIKH